MGALELFRFVRVLFRLIEKNAIRARVIRERSLVGGERRSMVCCVKATTKDEVTKKNVKTKVKKKKGPTDDVSDRLREGL